MRLFIRTLMFLGCLLYGAMPAQSAMNMPMAQKAGDFAANNGYPCPHRGDMKHAPFCAACIVVLPELAFLDADKTPFSYPKPGLSTALLTGSPAPPLRPPRA